MPNLHPPKQGLEIARTLAGSGAVDLVVVDSAAALVPQLELEAGIGDDAPGCTAACWHRVCASLRQTLARSGACVVFLNQMRNRPEASAGEGETSAGGPPLKLFAAVRIALIAAAEGRGCACECGKIRSPRRLPERELEWRARLRDSSKARKIGGSSAPDAKNLRKIRAFFVVLPFTSPCPSLMIDYVQGSGSLEFRV